MSHKETELLQSSMSVSLTYSPTIDCYFHKLPPLSWKWWFLRGLGEEREHGVICTGVSKSFQSSTRVFSFSGLFQTCPRVFSSFWRILAKGVGFYAKYVEDRVAVLVMIVEPSSSFSSLKKVTLNFHSLSL